MISFRFFRYRLLVPGDRERINSQVTTILSGSTFLATTRIRTAGYGSGQYCLHATSAVQSQLPLRTLPDRPRAIALHELRSGVGHSPVASPRSRPCSRAPGYPPGTGAEM